MNDTQIQKITLEYLKITVVDSHYLITDLSLLSISSETCMNYSQLSELHLLYPEKQ